MAEKKFKATIEIGGAVAGSLKSSFAAVTGQTKTLGQSLNKLTGQQKQLRAFNDAQVRIGETQKKLTAAMKNVDLSQMEKLRSSLAKQRESLASLGEELKKQKINLKDVSGEMERLGRKAESTRKVMESWKKLEPIGKNFKSVLTRAAGGFVAIGAAATAASVGVWKLGTAFGNFADSAAEGAATLGTDANFLLSVRYAASQVGASAEMADKALSEMNIRMVEAGEDGNKTGDALRELGLDVGALQKLDTASQFATISQAFKNYTGDVNKAKLATEIFGKSGRKIPNLLNLGKDGLEAYAKAAREAGYLLSETDMAMGDAFDEAMGQFNLALEGSRNIIGREILPVLTELMTSLGEFIRENAPNIKAVAQEFGGWLKTNGPIIGGQIRDMAKSLVEMGKAAWPFIESVGGVKAVLVGIAAVAFAPTIAAVASLGVSMLTAIPAIVSLTTGLWGMAAAAAGGSAALLPIIGTVALVAAGIAALGFAVYHVVQNWDTYSWAIKEAWTATTEFVTGMGTAIGGLVTNTSSTVAGIGAGIYNALSVGFQQSVSAATEFVTNMGSAIGGWVASTSQSFADFGTAIYNSIAGAFDSVTAKVSAWFDWVKGKLASVGTSISGLFGGGGESAPATPDGARAKGGPVRRGGSYLVGEQGPELFTPGASGSIIPNNRLGGSQSVDSRTYNITINAAPGMDERSLADLVLARLDGRQAALAGGALFD